MYAKHARWLLAVLLPTIVGCNLLTPLIFIGDHKKKVAPEFNKLADNRVAVLVWTDPATLFDYPYARLELATHLTGKLSAEMSKRGSGTDIVDPRNVEDFLQRNPDAQIDPRVVGEHFEAAYVIYVEVFEFQIRDADQPQFLRGRIGASVTVHDMRAEPDQPRQYELTPIDCVYPEGAPVLMTATNPPLIRESTYRKFAELAARKFYEYTVDL